MSLHIIARLMIPVCIDIIDTVAVERFMKQGYGPNCQTLKAEISNNNQYCGKAF